MSQLLVCIFICLASRANRLKIRDPKLEVLDSKTLHVQFKAYEDSCSILEVCWIISNYLVISKSVVC